MAAQATNQAFFVRAPLHETGGLQNDTFESRPYALKELGENDLLLESQFISVDPYLMGRFKSFHQSGSPIVSGQVARVIESRSESFQAGELVQGYFPMAQRCVLPAKQCKKLVKENVDMDLDRIKASQFLGAIGMPGATAYFGLLETCELNEGETVFVSGAAGAVGSIVGQIAKLKGCFVVGTAGSHAKCEFLREIGFDVALNYKEFGGKEGAKAAIKEAFGERGIDVYFDNTGGVTSNAIWTLLNRKGRVGICGQIAYYNDSSQGEDKLPDIKPFLHHTIYRAVTIRGFLVSDFADWTPFYRDMYQWITEGRIQVRETEMLGFEALPDAFAGLFTGQNFGKMVVNCQP